MKSFTSIALLAALASSASAVCTLSKAGHVWDLQIFDQVGCSKSGHYEEFHGTLDGNRCFNVASSLKLVRQGPAASFSVACLLITHV
jgi:hypothetical protein